LHRDTVCRVIDQEELTASILASRASKIDPYVPFIQATFAEYPEMCASRLYTMVKERGYEGSQDHFRHVVAQYRPVKPAEAFLRLTTMPGEVAQVDWAHFGTIPIGNTVRKLMGFVMVLAFSRMIFLHFFLDARTANFLRGHIQAFEAWGDRVPRKIWYDNLKSAVLERQGGAIRFNPELLSFASHYRFRPFPMAVARGNEKGRVERAIRYIRTSFFMGLKYTDIDDLNAKAKQWCNGQAADRACPEDKTMTVAEAFAREQPMLLQVPDTPYHVEDQAVVKVGKTPYVRFDLNDYSVPHTHVRRNLTLRASLTQVRIFDGADLIASHPRSYERARQIENVEHIQKLIEIKHRASQHRGMNTLIHAVPLCQKLLEEAGLRGTNIGAITIALLKLLDAYGPTELGAAVEEALSKNSPHSRAVRRALERRRTERGEAPPIPSHLSEHAKRKDEPVRQQSLGSYDQLISKENEENGDE